MKVNRKLLPIKAQYFFGNAGAAPVFPFLPLIIKDLGYSSVVFGWITTVCPVITTFLKPVVGSVVDKFQCLKSAVILIIAAQVIALFCFQWAPALPSDSSVSIECSNNLTLKICNEKLSDKCYAEGILESIANSTSLCEIKFMDEWSQANSNTSRNYLLDTKKDFKVKLIDGSIELDCLSLFLKNDTRIFSAFSSACANGVKTAELYCEGQPLDQIIRKTALEDNEVVFTTQFWVVCLNFIFFRSLMSTSASLMDAMCFILLGEKAENYGKQRMWGAIGWGLMSIISGYLVDYMSRGKSKTDYALSFYLMLILSLISIIFVAFVKVKQEKKSVSIGKDVKQLLKNTKICIFIVWCIIGGIYCSFIWNFLFWFIEDLSSRNGCSSKSFIKTLEGLVLSIHTYGGEIPFFFLSGQILKKLGHVNSMTLVLFGFGVRFLLYSSLSDPWWILPIETLNGVTFGVFYATMTTYASVISPPGTESTIQNLVGSAFEGVGVAIGGLLGGYLFKVLGSSQTFFVLGTSAVVFGFLHIAAHKITKDSKPEIYKSVKVDTKDSKEADDDDGIVF